MFVYIYLLYIRISYFIYVYAVCMCVLRIVECMHTFMQRIQHVINGTIRICDKLVTT